PNQPNIFAENSLRISAKIPLSSRADFSGLDFRSESLSFSPNISLPWHQSICTPIFAENNKVFSAKSSL
ncbi:hypothetical protein LINPERHAP1_LOCUS24444, partial [Linum perenne]